MALQVDYLSKIPQFAAQCPKSESRRTTQVSKESYLVNSNQALEWMAAQIAVIMGFEDGRLCDSELNGQALEFARQQCEKSAEKSSSKIDFISKVGDKLGSLRPEGAKRSQIDESLEAVWLPEQMFDKFGGEVFEIEPAATDLQKSEAKVSVRERRIETNAQTKAEDERQTELAAALRWAANVASL